MFDIRILYRTVNPLSYTDKFEREDCFSVGENPEEALREALKNRESEGEFHCAFITRAVEK